LRRTGFKLYKEDRRIRRMTRGITATVNTEWQANLA